MVTYLRLKGIVPPTSEKPPSTSAKSKARIRHRCRLGISSDGHTLLKVVPHRRASNHGWKTGWGRLRLRVRAGVVILFAIFAGDTGSVRRCLRRDL